MKCPICTTGGLRARRHRGNVIAYRCLECGERYRADWELDHDQSRIILLAKHVNPEFDKLVSSANLETNIKGFFENPDIPIFLETFIVGYEDLDDDSQK